MRNKTVKKDFYSQKTLFVAQALLGKFLVRKIGKKILAGMITETEGYCGRRDLASHASRGRTPRTEIMFGPPGRAYIYLIYGMHYCFNVVTEKPGYPAAVLIRGVEVPHAPRVKTNGPGKLCRYFRISRALNGADMTKKLKLWIEDRGYTPLPLKILKTPRIGIDFAGPYREKKWRFILKK